MDFMAEENAIARTKAGLTWILCINHSKMLDHPDFAKLLKARVFQPMTNSYSEYIWDPQMVVDYWSSRPHNRELILMELSQKVTTLLLLCTGKRPAEIRGLTLDCVVKTPLKFVFTLPHHTKTSRPKVLSDRQVVIKRFRSDPKVCPYEVLENYIKRTSRDRKVQNLILTANGTFTPVSSTTMSRWTRITMEKAGIDTGMFRPYSTRSAAASKLASKTGSLERVLELGKWRTTSAFFDHYLRKVKYFTRKNESSQGRARSINIPASPARRAASFSIRKSLMRKRDRNLPAPIIDVPVSKQGYLPKSPGDCSSTGISSVQVFDHDHNDAEEVRTMDRLSPSDSIFSFENAAPIHHPIVSPPPHSPQDQFENEVMTVTAENPGHEIVTVMTDGKEENSDANCHVPGDLGDLLTDLKASQEIKQEKALVHPPQPQKINVNEEGRRVRLALPMIDNMLNVALTKKYFCTPEDKTEMLVQFLDGTQSFCVTATCERSISVFNSVRAHYVTTCPPCIGEKLSKLLRVKTLFPQTQLPQGVELARNAIVGHERITLQIQRLHVALDLIRLQNQITATCLLAANCITSKLNRFTYLVLLPNDTIILTKQLDKISK